MFGEFEDEYATREEKLFFLMITIVGPLVLLNLLIAIITDLQDHAQSQNHIADIKEKLSFIEEIGKVFWFIKPTESGYIHSCSTKFLDGMNKDSTRWLGKVRELEMCIQNNRRMTDVKMKKLSKKMDKMTNWMNN